MSKYVLIIVFLLSFTATAQDVFHEKILSFEEDDLNGWQVQTPADGTQGLVYRSDLLYKHGKHSLCWEWRKGDTLSVDRPIGFLPADPNGKDTYLSTFVVWVYNDTPADDKISFLFGKNDQTDCSFDFRINFKGWRAAWVAFERDMQGKPSQEMNRMRILAPGKAKQGTLFFDHIILSALSDSRYQTPDFQVSEVNTGSDSHWLQLLKFAFYKPDTTIAHVSESRYDDDIRTIEKRFTDNLCHLDKPVDKAMVELLRQKVDAYGIRIKDNRVSGMPLWYVRSTEVYERFFDNWNQWYAQSNSNLDYYFDLMLQIACAYRNTGENEWRTILADQFMLLYIHAEEQGIAAGSGLGTIHHSGYSFRSYYSALYLMKDVLAKHGKQEDAALAMQWYAATGEVLLTPDTPGMDMDAFNTTAAGRLAGILMMKDSPQKQVYLKSFAKWIDNGMQVSDGLMGAFKPDGAVMHHCNLYPAYGIGGISGASLMTYLLSGTGFRVTESGHANLKHAMQTMRFYCNTKNWPVSISGRHPKGTESLISKSYALMALAGTPDGQRDIDPEMAAAYLRLTKYDKTPSEYAKIFTGQGFLPEDDPQGNISINYGCLNVHRRNHWLAAARGFSRYLWAAEHYIGANYYGRYLSHGSLFILTGKPDELITNATSAFRQTGWDWNSIPGTTAIHLPLPLLKANILNVDVFSGFEEMLHSDEAFAGSLSQSAENGIFAMKLHEHDKYNGSMKARKSIFFFDDMIVCLGSDIENDNTRFPTRTTLYQNALDSAKDFTRKDGKASNRLGKERFKSNGNVLTDHVRTGYYIAPGQQIELNRHIQESRDQATDTLTRGLTALAWIEHGYSPSAADYEYAVFPESTVENMKSIRQKMTKPTTALYEVIRKDRVVHAIRDRRINTSAWAVFEPTSELGSMPVAEVDKPCLIMLKEEKKGYLLTVADPDLNLYEGRSDDIYDENGKRIERSIYSRPWITNSSKESYLKIRLHGKWLVSDSIYCKTEYNDKQDTILTFTCRDGLSREVVLSQP